MPETASAVATKNPTETDTDRALRKIILAYEKTKLVERELKDLRGQLLQDSKESLGELGVAIENRQDVDVIVTCWERYNEIKKNGKDEIDEKKEELKIAVSELEQRIQTSKQGELPFSDAD